MKLSALLERDIWSGVPKSNNPDIIMHSLDTLINQLHPLDKRFIKKLEDEESEQAYLNNLQNSIERTGIKQPIQVELWDGMFHIPEGNHRIVVAKRLGIIDVPIQIKS